MEDPHLNYVNMQSEMDRISQEYIVRDQDLNTNDWKKSIYHPRNTLGNLFQEHNRENLIKAINYLDIDLDELKILDFGCGDGYWLRMMVELGANPENLTGIDLSNNRINIARYKNPAIQWIHSQQVALPIPSASQDIVMQIVVFSSILNLELAKLLAREMFRLTKVGGYILWIDHKRSLSEKLSGYTTDQVLDFFPHSKIVYSKLVHPSYFRRFHKKYSLASKIMYEFTKIMCDSWFLIIEKK
jgi:ubiquinone/menaquinone biosynthesis C-methylase UbiE